MRGSPTVKERKSLTGTTSEVHEMACTALIPSREDPLFRRLTETDEHEEEICEELLSIIQGSQSKCKDSGFYRRAPDVTEQLARLHIEEEPSHDNLESSVTIKKQSVIFDEGDSSSDTKQEVFELPQIKSYIYLINSSLIFCLCAFLHVSASELQYSGTLKAY